MASVFGSHAGLALSEFQNGVTVLNALPFSAAQKGRWFWERERLIVWRFAGIAAFVGIVWIFQGFALPVTAMLYKSAAGMAAVIIAGTIFALWRYFPAAKWLVLPAVVAAVAGFSGDLTALRPLNPVYWPILGYLSPDHTVRWLTAAGSLALPFATLLLIKLNAGSIAARLTEAKPEPLHEETATKPIQETPAGVLERFIDRTRTPRERAAAAICINPAAWPLLRSILPFLLCVAAVVIAAVSASVAQSRGWIIREDADVFHFGFLALAYLCLVTLRSKRLARDGFPFQQLVQPHTSVDGHAILPVALLPIGRITLWSLYLKSLWPRLLMMALVLLPAGILLRVTLPDGPRLWMMMLEASALLPLIALALVMLRAAELMGSWKTWRRYSLKWVVHGLLAGSAFMVTFPALGMIMVKHEFPHAVALLIHVSLCGTMLVITLLMTAFTRFARPDYHQR